MYVVFVLKTLGHYTRELCFWRWRNGPLAIPTFDFSRMFLALGIFTVDGKNYFPPSVVGLKIRELK